MNKTIFTLLALFSSQFLHAQPCTPSSSAGCILDYISYFSLKGEGGTEIQSPSGCSIAAYADNTATFAPVTLTRGNTYSGFLQTSSPDDYVTIWIDEDNDLVFEDQERLIHNLKPGSSKLLYGIHIPSSWSLGQRRMRVRLSYYASAPTYATVTDPCNLITFSETEDYLVNITNVGGSSFVAPGILNACTSAAVVQIGTATNNAGVSLVPIRDSNNHYVCNIYPNGNTLGTVQTTLFVHGGAIRVDPQGISMLNRNLTIQPEFQPSNTYNLRFFYLTSELNSLIADPGSSVTSQFDLSMTKNQQLPCASNVSMVPPGNLIFPTGYGSISGEKFLDFTNLSSFSTFYLHGGSTAIGNPAISLDAQPITLNMKDNSGNLMLQWTASPDQWALFELQRSEDGLDFRTIFSTNSLAGNHTFTYEDNPGSASTWYYRVRMQLADGRTYYSSILSWINTKRQNEWFQLVQNPINDYLILQASHAGTIQIYNAIGQPALSVDVKNGVQQIPVPTLPAGIYFLVSGKQRISFVKSK